MGIASGVARLGRWRFAGRAVDLSSSEALQRAPQPTPCGEYPQGNFSS